MLIKTLSKYKKLKCVISVGDDPKWEFYFRTLCPDVFDKQWKLDWEVVEPLKSHHDNLQLPREIRHWIYFPEIPNSEQFKARLDTNVYRIIEEETIRDSGYPYQLVISHTSSAEFETINKTTTELLKQTLEAQGKYDGWESPVTKY